MCCKPEFILFHVFTGAGTVEYLYNQEENKYYFLELNPRLQVEHPVTEGITGINLPALQLQIAMGIPLYCVPEIRTFYDENPAECTPIDFLRKEYRYPSSHVIAARITAENPDEGFKPTSGKIDRVEFQSSSNVWAYFSVANNGGIHEYADSQFGHVFAKGSTREEARKSLILALKSIDVRGEIRTTVEYLIKLLETKEFINNRIDTSWLDGIIHQKSMIVTRDPEKVALSAAIFKTHSRICTQFKTCEEILSKGQASLLEIDSLLSFDLDLTIDGVLYHFIVTNLGKNYYRLKINEQVIDTQVRQQPDGSLLCDVHGEKIQLYGQEESLGLKMKVDGETVLIPNVFNPSELRSDVTGKVVRFLQNDHDIVMKNEAYVEVEAMKMILTLKASETGRIHHQMAAGSIVAAGDLLATLALRDKAAVKPVFPFQGKIRFVPERNPPNLETTISLALKGYNHEDIEHSISTYFEVAKLQDIELFLSEQILQFVKIETPFDSWDESLAISRLLVSQKEEEVLLSIVAHKQIKQRMDIMLALLRQLEFLPQKYPEYDLRESCMDKKLLKAIETLANLKSTRFGIITLKAKEILDCASTPPFGQRLNSLRATLMSPAVDLDTLSRLPDMSVSIDLLTILMNDVESIVRRAAAETYIRRVYRAHIIHDVFIEEGRSSDGQIMTIQWNFSYRNMTGQEITPPIRQGYMEMHAEVINFETVMQGVMERSKTFLIKHPNYADSLNVLHVGFSKLPEQLLFEDEDKLGVMLFSTISRFKSELSMMGCRSLSFLTKSRFISNNENDFRLSHYNFLAENNFQENRVSRNMRPTLPQLLELNRMTKNYEVLRLPTIGRNAFLFLGREKQSDQNSKDVAQEVLFLRSISHSNESISLLGADRIISMALEELERAHLDPRVSSASSSRLFVYVIPENALNTEDCIVQFESIMDILIAKYATRLLKLRVDEIEVKLRVVDQNNPSLLTPIRLIASSSTGGWLTREAYRETIDPITGNTNQYCTFSGEQICILDPYPTSSTLQKKRATARRVGTTYAPDFLGLIEIALINSWQSYLNSIGKVQVSPPSNVLSFEELVLDNGKLIPMKRFPGNNRIGMLAWRSTWKTPHYPQGRDVVIIANDVTIQSGSFGVKEDEFFFKASEYARERGLPRIFISCNSGARIGLVEEMKQKIKVGWKDESNPISGFDYLYLSEDDFLSLPKGTVEATAITTSSGELRYQLSAVIGLAYGIGVENLKGSGLIAGETSRAYEESFTLSYVTGRSVGIGAYLNRLGQRVIQMRVGPMILTGFSALNKLLGREVYTSQDQLGGPQIMYSNGVSHQVVNDDPEGMQAVVDWISFVPEKFNVIAPKLAEVDALFDSPSRTIDFKPSKAPYDPRHMLAGVTSPDGRYLSGFFDKGSFKEYLGGWGKSVVVGRARLGGINVGTIAVETRLSEQRIPADPGNPQSRENVVMQAGQVWYPDSAYKTAQAIRDFNRGENLPLIIFANWRGFSGGTRDMFSEVLKFGAMIVDALREYKHPVFVYIPPEAELRGGAWVVIDPSINPDHMEMFADKNARGGILEPPGICEVKFRTQEQNLAMQRLDPILQDLYEAVGSAITVDEKAKLNMEIKTREKLLAPLYLQIAHEFADLHDRAGRMKAKDCIVDILNWENSREFFYWRILLKQKFQKVCNYLRSDTGDSFSYMELTEKVRCNRNFLIFYLIFHCIFFFCRSTTSSPQK